ncbi:hypothetical protein WNY58_16020 [Neptuniibacter pectenicola]|uniref:Capsule polysaccharide biosynthesis protein n=1 Tax=Neptuniibacter pectenicola TaxID=1806669 RepID=A0ABU9TVZ9_9GAMM
MSDLSKLKVMLTDDVHFHKRNFNSLFTFFEKSKIKVENAKAPSDWIALYGNYFSKSNELRKSVIELSFLSKEELQEYVYKGVPVFESCKLEFLSHVIAKPKWRSLDLLSNSDVVFDYAFELDVDALLHNMAAVIFWVDWWENKLRHIPQQNYACVFSGSLIYSDVLIRLLKKHVAEPVIMESFFTGNEYYCEKKYQHIPNNSDLKFDTYYKSLMDFSGFDYDRERIKAINKIFLSKNKNVTQPGINALVSFDNSRDVVVILGQVLNDFSVLGGVGRINSLAWYKEIISKLLLETDSNIIFKAHPWENKKIGLSSPVTKLELQDFVRNNFDSVFLERFVIVEDYNLQFLLEQSDYTITLCSQSAIEAAFMGIKPVQLGNAFFGRKGFTSDYASVSSFISDYKSGKVFKNLTLKEFDCFERFCVVALCKHLVSCHASGLMRLREVFTVDSSIKLVGSSNINKKTVDENVKKNKVDEKSESVKEGVVVGGGKNEVDVSFESKVDLTEFDLPISEQRKLRRQRLWGKFRRNPHAYFNDSSNKYERQLRFLFKKR